MAFLPAHWQAPARISPAWLAGRPLILNDASTRLSRLTSEWFALGGFRPAPRIELNFNDAIKSLVAAGYGAALLPHEAGAPQADARIAMRALRPAMRSEEHTSELQSLMRNSYAVFCLKKKKRTRTRN